MLDIESRLTGTAVDGAQPGHSILLWQIIYNAMVPWCHVEPFERHHHDHYLIEATFHTWLAIAGHAARATPKP